MRVINSMTGAEIVPGTIVRMTVGPTIGQPWRLEHIAVRVEGDHHLRVSRTVTRIGRVHKEFHPDVFGCHVVIDLLWHHRMRLAVRHGWMRVDDWLMAGVFALVPLAFFERFHMAEHITNAMGMRGH